jgi:hypothetical protein
MNRLESACMFDHDYRIQPNYAHLHCNKGLFQKKKRTAVSLTKLRIKQLNPKAASLIRHSSRSSSNRARLGSPESTFWINTRTALFSRALFRFYCSRIQGDTPNLPSAPKRTDLPGHRHQIRDTCTDVRPPAEFDDYLGSQTSTLLIRPSIGSRNQAIPATWRARSAGRSADGEAQGQPGGTIQRRKSGGGAAGAGRRFPAAINTRWRASGDERRGRTRQSRLPSTVWWGPRPVAAHPEVRGCVRRVDDDR